MEIWKSIEGFEGLYEVSNLGRVKSLDQENVNGRRWIGFELSQSKDRYGYPKVMLRKEGKQKSISVHRLVAGAFIDNPHGKPQVNHIDGIKTNNKWDNLEWNTALENMTHARETGLNKRIRRKSR